MNIVNIKEIDLNNSFFHFTKKANLESIKSQGLTPTSGDASQMKKKKKPRVYMSKGGKGILGIKNSFIHEMKKLRICDIPLDYRSYFAITDYTSTEKVNEKDVYDAMEKRFKDEIYFKVDAVEGEDYDIKDFYPEELLSTFRASTNERDVKGKENHTILPSKLTIMISDKGDTVFDIVDYLYSRLLENARQQGKEESVRYANSDLDAFLTYIKNKKKMNFKESIKVTSKELQNNPKKEKCNTKEDDDSKEIE